MWITLILRNWQLLAIALLAAALGVSMLHGRAVTAERDAKIAEIDSMRREAQTYKENSEQIAKEISDAIPRMVEQAKSDAWKNYKVKYGMGNATCGIRADGLLLPAGTGETNRPEGTDVPSGERLVIESCARDAGRLNLWIEWAKMNQLPVE